MEFHNVVRSISGYVIAERVDQFTIVIRGEQSFDIREFNLAAPATAAMQIYPDVTVEMQLEARVE